MTSRITKWKHGKLEEVQKPIFRSKLSSGCVHCLENDMSCLAIELLPGKRRQLGWTPFNWWTKTGIDMEQLVDELKQYQVACLSCLARRGSLEDLRAAAARTWTL